MPIAFSLRLAKLRLKPTRRKAGRKIQNSNIEIRNTFQCSKSQCFKPKRSCLVQFSFELFSMVNIWILILFRISYFGIRISKHHRSLHHENVTYILRSCLMKLANGYWSYMRHWYLSRMFSEPTSSCSFVSWWLCGKNVGIIQDQRLWQEPYIFFLTLVPYCDNLYD